MTIEFAPTEDGEKHRILSKFAPLSFSVGFIPTDSLRPSQNGWGDQVTQLLKEWPEFRRVKDLVQGFIRKWVLLEVSAVNVASNPRALQLDAAKAVSEGKLDAKEADICVKGFGADTPIQISTPPDAPPVKKAAPVQIPDPIKIVERASIRPYRPNIKTYSQPLTAAEVRDIVIDAVKESFELLSGRV